MTARLGNGSIIFGDGSVQTTKTPANVSAFTNDRGYITNSSVSPTYATIGQAMNAFSWGGSGMALQLQWYNVDNQQIGAANFNCNCNC